MMRKLIALLPVLLLSAALVYGQTKTVRGIVTDEKGNPVAFATITEDGTNNSVKADETGKYAINVKPGARLVVTASGHTAQTVEADSASTVTLAVANAQLSEVVVTTAFGIKKSQRVTPYSAQVISDEQLRIIPQTNINNALAGKVAGVQFRGQSPMKLNDQGLMRVRGGMELSGDLAPVFVVDGTIVNSFDINPDDVDNLTILKGANATALFGERAKNGAVVITTKKAPAGTTRIEVSQGITIDRVYILPDYQNQYAGGSTPELTKYTWQQGHPVEWKVLDGAYFHDYTDDASWGPRISGQQYAPWYAWIPGHKDYGKTVPLQAHPNNARDFYSTGVTSTTNVAFAKGGPGYNTRISYTNNSIKGMLPNSSSYRHTLSLNGSIDIGRYFTAGASVNFINNRISGEFNDEYSNQSSGAFNQWFHRNLDMKKMKELRNLRTPAGTLASWNFRRNPDAGSAASTYRGNYWYNPYSWFDAIDNKQNRNRIFGDAFLTYKVNDDLKIKGTVRRNQFTTSFENITPTILENSALQTGVLASYATGHTSYEEMNYEGLASYTRRFFNRLDVNVNAGGNLLKTIASTTSMATRNGLNVPDLYAITNSKDQPTLENERQRSGVRSLFINSDFEYNRFVSFTASLRQDWYSTLPDNDNGVLSPSLGASLVFSEFTKNNIQWLSFGKVFGSWGKKPTSLNIYQNNFLYEVNQAQWEGNILMATPNTLIAEGLRGSQVNTFEVGVDLRFMRNRFGLNLVYFDERNEKAPVNVSIDPVSGYQFVVVNAASIERRGIEVTANASVLKSKNFDWSVTKNFSYLIDNPVTEIFGNQKEYLLAQSAFTTRVPRVFQVKGKDWGQLRGGGIKRNEEGIPLLTSAGLFVADEGKEWGSVVPKINGGLVNTFTYKNVLINFNIDYQFGGKFFSLSENWGHYSGLLKATAATNDKGMNVRDAIADGGGVHVVGVSATDGRTPVDLYVDAQTYFHQFYNSRIYEPFIHSLSYVKLREVSIGYQVPVQKLGLPAWFKGVSASLVARNPWLLYRETKSFDPSEISDIQGEDGQFPGTRSFGLNLKFNF